MVLRLLELWQLPVFASKPAVVPVSLRRKAQKKRTIRHAGWNRVLRPGNPVLASFNMIIIFRSPVIVEQIDVETGTGVQYFGHSDVCIGCLRMFWCKYSRSKSLER